MPDFKITLWKDREKGIVDPFLFSTKAEEFAKKISDEHSQSRGNKSNKRTQIRKFYDEVIRLDMEAKARKGEWSNILPLVHMLIAKAAYANGREKLISDTFLNFIRDSISQIKDPRDLSVFANFFEAFMGFYRKYGPKN
jgi:CRISPR-associated protein Csm2